MRDLAKKYPVATVHLILSGIYTISILSLVILYAFRPNLNAISSAPLLAFLPVLISLVALATFFWDCNSFEFAKSLKYQERMGFHPIITAVVIWAILYFAPSERPEYGFLAAWLAFAVFVSIGNASSWRKLIALSNENDTQPTPFNS